MNTYLMAFNGERADPIGGVYHLGNGYRAYYPQLRRFTTPDNYSPFDAGGINPYAYCAGDPFNRADPSGHFSWQTGLGIGLGLLGILGAIFSAGTSIAASFSFSAALAESSTLVADVTGIASIAIAQRHPRASARLGWASFAAGMLSLGIGLAAGGWRLLNNTTKGLRQRLGAVMHQGLSGDSAQAAQQMNRAGLNLNDQGLHEEMFTTPVYRADRTPPSIILSTGFRPSNTFRGVAKMTSQESAALIVAENAVGALRYRQWGSNAAHIYEIDARGMKGVSLLKNLTINKAGLAEHLSHPAATAAALENADSLDINLYTNRASYFHEAHLYHQQVTPDRIRVMTAAEIRIIKEEHEMFDLFD